MPRGTNQLNKDGMTAVERREAKMELVLQGRLQWWRKLMSEGKDSRAEHYATTYSLHELVAEELAAMQKFKTVMKDNQEPSADEPLAPAVEATILNGAAGENARREALADRYVELSGTRVHTSDCATSNAPAFEPGPCDCANGLKDGWPVKCVASVEKYPINPRMVIARLPDGREVRLWNDGARRWKLGAKVKVKIEEAGAEPIYVGDFDEA